MSNIVIALDGFASTGKSTLAKDLAKELKFAFIDTGAMYRAFTLHCLRNNYQHGNSEHVQKALQEVNISFKFNAQKGRSDTYLNDEYVEDEIRDVAVTEYVTAVSAVKSIREKIVAQQQSMGLKNNIVMDGRDIGTAVFPNADLKFFVIADLKKRTERRHNEMIGKGIKISRIDVQKSLMKRDLDETTRTESPLLKANDAIIIDTSYTNQQEQLQVALQHVSSKLPQ